MLLWYNNMIKIEKVCFVEGDTLRYTRTARYGELL